MSNYRIYRHIFPSTLAVTIVCIVNYLELSDTKSMSNYRIYRHIFFQQAGSDYRLYRHLSRTIRYITPALTIVTII